MNAPSGRGDRRRSDRGGDDEDPLARDFQPPQSHVRKRPPPRLTASLSEFEEGLAYQAASDQLTNRRKVSVQWGVERRVHQSSHSSASSLGNLHDTADLYRRPVGSFAEDSPPRDRRSPFDPHFFGYLSRAETQPEDPQEVSKWPQQFNHSPHAYTPGSHSVIKQESPSPPHPPPSDGVMRSWNTLFDSFNDPYSGSTTHASPTKTIPTQDVFRSPTLHDLKKTSSRSSPTLSLGVFDTPGAQSHNFSPMPGFEEYVEDKRLRLGSSMDEEERFSFDSYPPPPSPLNELEGVRCSPLQSSSERKSSDSKASPNSHYARKRDRPHSVPPESKSNSLDGSTSSQQRRVDRHPSNVRRVTMGEPQSARSLADINTMVRGQVDTTTAVVLPETPIPEPSSAKGHSSKSPEIEPVPLAALEPLQVPPTIQKPPVKGSKSIGVSKLPAVRPTITSLVQKTKARVSAPRPPPSQPPLYRYPPQQPATQQHRYPGRYHHGHPMPYPPPTRPLFPPEFVPPQGMSPHVPPNYHPRPTNTPIVPATYPPPPALNLPPRFNDERISSPMLPGGFAVPSTPRLFAGAYAQRPPSRTANLPSMSYPFPPHPGTTGNQYPWSNSALKLPPPPPPRFSPPHSMHASASDSAPPSGPPPAPAGKENAPVTPVKAKRVPCNCKKSRCLKLYCDCFSAQLFCDGCNCIECLNTEQDSASRDKAVKDTLHKNRTAFEIRAPGALTAGCKCKRSECLKKYCECFEAGIVCVDHCKCIGCSNRAGSQKLIDKRRKMKDNKGLEYAIKISEEVWMHSIPGAAASGIRKPPIKQPLPRVAAPPEYYPRHTRTGPNAALDFSPLGNIGEGYHRMIDDDARVTEVKTLAGAPPMKTERMESPMEVCDMSSLSHAPATVAAVTVCAGPEDFDARKAERPRTPAGVRRLSFDSTSASVRKKQRPDGYTKTEVFVDIFGPDLPALPMSKSVYIFQFLSKADLYHASLTAREWNILITDKLSSD